MKTDARDEALLEDIAGYFDILASDSEAFAARGMGKRENATRAKVWRQAAADVRSIELLPRADLAQAPAPLPPACPYGFDADGCCGGYCGMEEQHTGRPDITTDGFLSDEAAAALAAEMPRQISALDTPDAGVVAELVEAVECLLSCEDPHHVREARRLGEAVLAKLGVQR